MIKNFVSQSKKKMKNQIKISNSEALKNTRETNENIS